MKAILEFNLPDEEVKHRNAVDANKAFSLISWINNKIHARIKYGKGDISDEGFLVEIRRTIYDEFQDIDER